MVEFRIDKETSNYIVMDRHGLLYLGLKGKNLPNDAYQEVSNMINGLVPFEYSAKENLEQIGSSYLSSFKIRKDSVIGKYLIENAGYNEIINKSEFIHYSDIVNALNIALFDGEDKTSNKIFPLFKERIFGSKKELLKKFPEWVLDYILENKDFEKHLKKIDSIKELGSEEPIQEENAYVVYEDGEWSIKNLEEEYKRISKKA